MLRRTCILLWTGLLLALAPGIASAAWTAGGTGAGAARATTLSAPGGTNSSLTCTGSGVVTVNWTTATVSSFATGYQVLRNGANAQNVNGRTTTSFQPDLGNNTGLQSFTVVSVVGNWRSAPVAVGTYTKLQSGNNKC